MKVNKYDGGGKRRRRNQPTFSLPYEGSVGKSTDREIAKRKWQNSATPDEMQLGYSLTQDEDGNFIARTRLESYPKYFLGGMTDKVQLGGLGNAADTARNVLGPLGGGGMGLMGTLLTNPDTKEGLSNMAEGFQHDPGQFMKNFVKKIGGQGLDATLTEAANYKRGGRLKSGGGEDAATIDGGDDTFANGGGYDPERMTTPRYPSEFEAEKFFADRGLEAKLRQAMRKENRMANREGRRTGSFPARPSDVEFLLNALEDPTTTREEMVDKGFRNESGRLLGKAALMAALGMGLSEYSKTPKTANQMIGTTGQTRPVNLNALQRIGMMLGLGPY